MQNIIQQYTNDALRTESTIEKVKLNPMFLLSVLALAQCAGSMLDQIKKHAFYGKDYDKPKLVEDFQMIVGSLDGVKQTFKALDEESELDIDPRIFHAILGIATESTELLEALIITGEEMDTVNILEEVGDLMWYNSILVDSTKGDWANILNTNIMKLRKRYPEKFTSTNAIDRDIASERVILDDELG